MIYIIMVASFVLGLLIGCIINKKEMKKHHVGSLIIDLKNPYNDTPFLLELNTDVNKLCKMGHILLIISHK